MAPLPWLTTAFFLIALPPALYVLNRHGRHGLPGWPHALAFCALRLVSAIMQIKADNGATYGAAGVKVVNSVDVAALLLAGAGLLLEARRARNVDRLPRVEWFLIWGFHAVIVAAVGLMWTGIAQVVNGNLQPSGVLWTWQTSTSLKGAMALLFVCWGFLLAGAVFSLRLPGDAVLPATFNDGAKLLLTILFILPFVLCKIIYIALSFFLYDSNFGTSDTNKAMMSFVPEVIVTVMLLWVGIATRQMWTGTSSKVKKAPMESNGWYALEDVPERFAGMRD